MRIYMPYYLGTTGDARERADASALVEEAFATRELCKARVAQLNKEWSKDWGAIYEVKELSVNEGPNIIPSTRYYVRAVIDGATCDACRNWYGYSILVPDDEPPPVLPHHCEHVKAGIGICRCVIERSALG